MADCVADLRAEHRGVLQMLDILDAMQERFDENEPVPPEDLQAALDFLRTFVDQCHHEKEEGLLFPAMTSAAMTGTADLVTELEQEHVMGREYVGRIAEEIDSYSRGDQALGYQIARDLHGYAELLRRHIALEEDVLYPQALEQLPEYTQERLVEGYDRVEREVVGEGRHEAFHEMLARMRDKYLQPA